MNCMTYSTFDNNSTINNILISVNRSSFTLVFFKAACHGNPGAVRKWAESSSCISRQVFQKFSSTSVNNNALL